MAEQGTHKPLVDGSNPSLATYGLKAIRPLGHLCLLLARASGLRPFYCPLVGSVYLRF